MLLQNELLHHIDIINAYININNALKEQIHIKDVTAKELEKLYRITEENYQKEQIMHRVDNISNRVIQFLLLVGIGVVAW